jgi:hypothetical protein
MIDSKDYLGYIQFWRDIADAHIDIKGFVHGTTKDINTRSRSELEYPCLWLETPSVGVMDNNKGNRRGKWRGGFVILQTKANINDAINTDSNPELARDTLYHETLIIALDVQMRLKKLFRDADLEYDLQTEIEPIETLFIDDDIGWRISYVIDFQFSQIYNPAKFGE